MSSNDYAAIPMPTTDNLLDCVNALKQTVEALIGLRGTSDSTAVTGSVDTALTLTGDVTGQGSGSIATTIQPHAVGMGDLAQIAAGTILGNPTGATADVQAAALTAYLDRISSTRGVVLYRGATGWAALPPGSAGQYLQTQGAGADPQYATITIPAQPWTQVKKTADQSTTSTTLTNLTDLSFPIAANQVIAFRAFLSATDTSVAGGFGLSGPASPTKLRFGPWGGGQQTAYGTTGSNANLAAGYYALAGLISNGANAGTVNLQFSVGSGGTFVVEKNSFLEYCVIA